MRFLAATMLVAFVPCLVQSQDKGPASPKPNFSLRKETTFVTGPVDKDGRVDYAAALALRMGKGVTPETNANVAIWRALGPKPEGGRMPPLFFKRMGIDEPPEEGDYFLDMWRFAKDHLDIDDQELREQIEEQVTLAGRQPWSAKAYPYVADWLKANAKPLALVVDGVKRKHYFSPLTPTSDERGSNGLISGLLPAVQKCRMITRALTCRAMLNLHDGKFDAAWEDMLACHRLGRHVGRGGTFIEALVGIAIEQIALRTEVAFLEHPDIDAKRLLGYLRDLQAMTPMRPVDECVDLSERFLFLDCVMMLDRYGLKSLEGLGLVIPAKGPPREGPLNNINWDDGLRNANKFFDRTVAAMRLQNREKRELELNQIEKELATLKTEVSESDDINRIATGIGIDPLRRGKVVADVLITALMPAVRKVQMAADRVEQARRVTHVAFALAAYHRDQKSYPKLLADLTPKYLDKIPGDQFNGQPLKYRPYHLGFIAYSVGPNGIDEDGRYYDDEPRGDDPSVRLPRKK